MRPDDMQSWMLSIAKEADPGDPGSLVFVMRKALTEAHALGFEEGLAAARRDEFVLYQIRQQKEQADDGS